MRHRKGNKKLGKPTDQRLALIKNQVLNLFDHQQIKTTETRAKEVRRMAEKLITLGVGETLHKRRQALSILNDKDIVKKLFAEIAPKYKDRKGGYTQITKIGFRRGDAAPMAILELVG